MKISDLVETYNESTSSRDVLFIFVWQLARVVAHGHARGHDAELLSDRIVASMMDKLDKGKYRHTGGSTLAPYLVYVCWKDAVRACAELSVKIPPEDSSSPIEDELQNEGLMFELELPELRTLRKQLDRLPNNLWRNVMLLKYDYHLTNAQIAGKLGIKEQSVNTFHNRALNYLRGEMKP